MPVEPIPPTKPVPGLRKNSVVARVNPDRVLHCSLGLAQNKKPRRVAGAGSLDPSHSGRADVAEVPPINSPARPKFRPRLTALHEDFLSGGGRKYLSVRPKTF